MCGTEQTSETEAEREKKNTYASAVKTMHNRTENSLLRVYNTHTHAHTHCIKTSTIEHYACLGHKCIKYVQFDTNRDT